MGTPDFAVTSLDALVQAGHDIAAAVTIPDKQTGRGLKTTYSPIKNYALQHHIPLLQPEKLRDESFIDALKALKADLFIVVAFRMLPKVVWSIPPLGTFNLHASLLPQYRGAAPINWAIINGEQKSGVTTFLLNEQIDEGLILQQRETAISDDDTAETLHDRLAEIGSELVVETVEGLLSHTLKPYPQQTGHTLRPAPKIFKQDCKINWNDSGKNICNFVRGLSPYPAATATFSDAEGTPQIFKIFQCEFEKSAGTTVGEVVTDQKNYLKIGVSDGFIKIISLQISGKKKNLIEEFLRGHNVSKWKTVI